MHPDFSPASLRSGRACVQPQFDAVYASRPRASTIAFSVMRATPMASMPRLGLVDRRKAVGNSVARNRVKRLVRESFRLRG